MKKKLAILLMVALIPVSGAVACGQAVEDRAREEVDKQVEKGKQRVNDEVQKGQDRIGKELSNAQKQAQDGANQAKEKAGGGQ